MHYLEKMLAVCQTVIDEEVRLYLTKNKDHQSDVKQEAHVAAIKAIRSYNPKRSDSRTAWVRVCIRGHLQNYRRQKLKQFIAVVPPEQFRYVVQDEPTYFDSTAFFAELTEDAKIVLSIIFDPDPDFWRPKRSQRDRWLNLLTNHLSSASWTTTRISAAFSCIRNALA